VGVEILEREVDALLGLLDRKAAHRARRIEHEDELLRRHVLCRDAIRGLKNEREETAAVVAVREYGVLYLLARDLVLHDEVAVRDLALVLERHDGGALVAPDDIYVVQGRAHVLDR